MKKTQTLALFFVLAIFTSASALQVGFYKGKCGGRDVESIVNSIVRSRFSSDPTLVAALLRMQFHDCFVNGCDASILLDVPSSEKTAGANGSVRGYEVIDAIKKAIEAVCPGVVSCADIIVMATRDTVALAKGVKYNVQTGRLDGKVSRASDVNLPGPSISIAQATALFASKGLSASDFALLLGAHTVGITHCSFFQDRLYNFQGTGRPDPTMSTALASSLRQRCPRSSSSNSAINLDQNPSSALIVDNSFYKQIRLNRGILQVDQELASSPITRGTVAFMAANNTNFNIRFGNALVKLGALQNKVGEIRTNCRAVNKAKPRSPPPPPPRKPPPPPPRKAPPPPFKVPTPPIKAPLPPLLSPKAPPPPTKAPPPPPPTKAPPPPTKAPPPPSNAPPPPSPTKAPPPLLPLLKAPPPPPGSNATTGLTPAFT